MRKEELQEALQALKLQEEERERLQHNIETELAKRGNRAPAPRHRWLLGGAGLAALALVVLLLGRGWPGGGTPDWQLTLHAWAAEGQPLEQTLSAQAVELDLQYGFFGQSGDVSTMFYGGKGEGFLNIAFTVAGEGIESITYTAAGCQFAEFLVLHSMDDYPRSPDRVHRPGIDLDFRSFPVSDDGQVGVGLGIRYLGQSYTVRYEDQLDRDYRVSYPLTRRGAGEAGEGVVVWQQEEEDPWIWPWKIKPDDWPTQRYDYVAQEAQIGVEICFTDGSVQRQTICLIPQEQRDWSYPFCEFQVVLETQ